VIAWVQVSTLAVQVLLLVIICLSTWYAIKTRRNINKTLDALTAYRREVDWFVARLDALEKKHAEKTWQVIEGRGNGRQN
jgi:hypothetical protein